MHEEQLIAMTGRELYADLLVKAADKLNSKHVSISNSLTQTQEGGRETQREMEGKLGDRE